MKTIKCPYCGVVNKVSSATPYDNGKNIYTCDSEESGGCDKDFVLVKEITVNLYALKIEGWDSK